MRAGWCPHCRRWRILLYVPGSKGALGRLRRHRLYKHSQECLGSRKVVEVAWSKMVP